MRSSMAARPRWIWRESDRGSAVAAGVGPGGAVEGVLGPGEALERVEHVLVEVDVDVVRGAAGVVRPDAEHHLRVAALVHDAGHVVVLVDVPAAGHVTGLVRGDVADRPADEPGAVARR